MRRFRRRASNAVARAIVLLLATIAIVPLLLVLVYVVRQGLPTMLDLNFFTQSERPVGIPGGGESAAIVGTLVIVGLASLAAIPIGVLAGFFLAEMGNGWLGSQVRLATDVLVAAPSIAVGLFAYTALVAPFKHFSALSASVALAVLMLPIVARITEGAVRLVPGSLRESGVALGLPRYRVSLQLVLPAALPGVITGAFLAVARAAGETAPLLFTAFGNQRVVFDPRQEMDSLTLVVFRNALTPFPQLQNEAWAAALLLVLIVLLANLTTRLALRRQARLAQRLV
ncbi:MAG TPA: phosphate ABC transporter permease PstA [Candidatus Dormibacteraeota bacterium]